MDSFKHTLTVGTIDTGYATRALVTVEIEWVARGSERFGQVKPEGCLSLMANAKRPRARDWDQGGQMQGTLAEHAERDEIEYLPGWDRTRLERLLALWNTYHLNDMQAACEHQRALGWTYSDHPSEPCPECGYKLGSAWLTMPVPDEVLAELKGEAA